MISLSLECGRCVNVAELERWDLVRGVDGNEGDGWNGPGDAARWVGLVGYENGGEVCVVECGGGDDVRKDGEEEDSAMGSRARESLEVAEPAVV